MSQYPRLCRKDLATAHVLWQRGLSTYEIMIELNNRKFFGIGGSPDPARAISEAAVANSLADLRERNRARDVA